MEEIKLANAIMPKENITTQIPTEIYQLSGPSEVVSGVSFVDADPSRSIPETVYVTDSLPDGYTMAFEESGQQYVTIMQDHHAFAIPLAEYQAMQQSGETTITIQTQADDGGHTEYYEATQIVSIPSDATILTEQVSPTGKKGSIVWQSHHEVQTQEHVLEAQEQSSLQTLDLQQSSLQHKLPPNKRLLARPQYQQQPTSFQVQLGHKHAQISSKGVQSPNSTHQLTVETDSLLEKLSASTVSDLDTKPFKAIQVDNWGIFLLSRFMHFYQKKEQCDLTLRFPSKNAQIFVHKLVINSCTDYFLKCERNGLIVDGALDMPDDFAPDSVAAIIRFLYTGRLDVKSGMFSNIYKVASKMQLFVLMRLMDAQAENPTDDTSMRNPKRRLNNDPVSQIKKIKRVERKFTAEEKRQRLNLAKQEEMKTTNSIPGKKLPIWRRKVPDWCSNQVSNSSPKMDSSNAKASNIAHFEAGIVSENSKSSLKKGSSSSPVKAYGKGADTTKSKMLTKQIIELQTNLTFEKVRNAGIINSSKSATDEPVKDMTVDEIKAFMDEQRKRFADLGENIDDDDYYDNDAEMDYGDDPGEDDDTVNISLVEPFNIKPILKTPLKQDNVQNKSVRFSLSNDECSVSNATIDLPEPEPIVQSKDVQYVAEQAQDSSPSSSMKTVEGNTETPKQQETKEKKPRIPPQPPGQPDMNVINEILKQHPELLKENGAVRVKLKTVDANGKSVIKTFSLKAQNPLPKPSVKPPLQVSGPTLGARETPKVCYTGKRGRPKKVKPGEVDPHELERNEINQRLRASQIAKKSMPSRNLRRLNYDSDSLKISAGSTSELDTQNGSISLLSDDQQPNIVANQIENSNRKLPASVKALSLEWDDD